MRVVIAGGHSGAGLRLASLLSARGDAVIALVPSDRHRADVRAHGARPVVLDSRGLVETLPGADAVVFTGGTTLGPTERPAALAFADGVGALGIRRYVLLSTMAGAARADDSPERAEYLRTKAETEAEIACRDLDWTIVRAGRMTDDPGSGLVELGGGVTEGEVPRADVAAVLAALVAGPWCVRRTVGLVGGSTPVDDAVRAPAD